MFSPTPFPNSYASAHTHIRLQCRRGLLPRPPSLSCLVELLSPQSKPFSRDKDTTKKSTRIYRIIIFPVPGPIFIIITVITMPTWMNPFVRKSERPSSPLSSHASALASSPASSRAMLSTLLGSVRLLQRDTTTTTTTTYMQGMALTSQPPRRTKLIVPSKEKQQQQQQQQQQPSSLTLSSVVANVALYTGLVFISIGVSYVWAKTRHWMGKYGGLKKTTASSSPTITTTTTSTPPLSSSTCDDEEDLAV